MEAARESESSSAYPGGTKGSRNFTGFPIRWKIHRNTINTRNRGKIKNKGPQKKKNTESSYRTYSLQR
jgi:hypothetical protein